MWLLHLHFDTVAHGSITENFKTFQNREDFENGMQKIRK